MTSNGKGNGARQRSLESIYLDVRQRILTKAMYPGQKLSENLLARKYGTSRTPIRETLKRLEDEGLVRIVPQSGTYVQRRSTRKIVELYQVRTYLECLALRLAVSRVTPDVVRQLSSLAGRFERSLKVRPFNARAAASVHYRFHHRIVKTSGNQTLLQFYERLHLAEAHVFDQPADDEGQKKTCAEHRRLVQLLEQRSPEAESLMRRHLWETAEYLIAAGNDGRPLGPSRSKTTPRGPADRGPGFRAPAASTSRRRGGTRT